VVGELRTGGPGEDGPSEDGLAECDLDAGDLRLREDFLAAHGRVLGVYAHPKEKGTGFLSDLGEVDRVNARPPEVNGIKVFVYLST